MASSNRHWPSMFKSKPCNNHHQWQHDINQSLISTGCQRPPYSSGCEERSPEPKPRWNPKPEQIRILEAIFNSGMVNPPREEIRKIRAQLQEYGQVGDANVFYWFQNRKSRSKHKLRHLQNSKQNNNSHQQQTPTSISSMIPSTIAPSSSSSSSSDHQKSSPKVPNINKTFSMAFTNITDVSNSSTASVNQTSLFQNPNPNEFYNEPFVFPVHQSSPGFNCFSHDQLSNINVVHDHVLHEQNVGPCTSLLLSELMNHGTSKRDYDGNKVTRMESQHNYSIISTAPTTSPTVTPQTTAMSHYIQGVGEQEEVGPDGAAKSTVFINDVPFEVVSGPFNVREAFGDEAVLIHSSGQPVLTNDWGVTLQSLQNGAFYYLI